MQKRLEWARKNMPVKSSICPNCGEEGPHFAPPSLREEGFFTCEKKSTTVVEYKETDIPKTLSEVCGLPAGSFEKYLKSEEAKNLP